MSVRLSVVIPALNEAETLPLLLEDLRPLSGPGVEVLVVDGGSRDATVAVARAAGARVLISAPGRGRQLRLGAAAATGDWLLFLHADSRLARDAIEALRTALDRPPPFTVAVFQFAIDLPHVWKAFIERGQAVRQALLRLPYGDQGLLVRRAAFEAIGGYPDIPIMEDVALVEKLRRRWTVERLPARLLTSGRRYLDRGVLRTWLQHTVLIFLFGVGVAPSTLAAWREGTNAAA